MKKNELRQLLLYPINASAILRKKKAIQRELLLKQDLLPKKIAILGGSSTSEVKEILELFLLDIGIIPTFYESEYNKFYEESVFENKALAAFQPDILYIHTTNKNILSYPNSTDSLKDIDNLLQQEQNKYKVIWDSLGQYHCPIIQNNFDFPQHRTLGNLEAYDPRGALNYINRLNLFFAEEAHGRANLYLNDINYLAASIGLAHWFDKHLWYSARYALNYEAIPHLAKNLSAIIGGLFGLSKKCLVLDLDNTCWGGEIGEEGLQGITLGKETAVAEVYTDFQQYLKALKERGIVLAVNSKNEMKDAKEGFNHPDTVLAYDDFAAFEANWEPKYTNILRISKALDLGLDSFVFIDDSGAERQIISDNLPEVAVPDVGPDAIYFMDYLDKNLYFETVKLSNEDLQRSTFYKRKSESLKGIEHFVNYEDYLDSLSMQAEIRPFVPMYLDRIAQLINKTNQFNLTTKRYAFAEVEKIAQNRDYIALYGRLEDRYGDNGLVSVIIGRIKEHACHVDLWLMSCRVLKRTMEYAMFDALVARCESLGIKTIIGYYYKTPKNSLVAHVYEDLGFEKSYEGDVLTWRFHIKNHINLNKHIKVIE